MLELSSGGFEERDVAGGVELAVYTDEPGETLVRRTFRSVSSTAVDAGWEDRWRDFHRPVRAGGLWIGPPWLDPPAGETTVVVDPGRAFGTGAHPTTRACVELLAQATRGSLLDAGCGSGVLAVAACRLGFGPVSAIDDDPAAVEAAERTAGENGVSIRVQRGDVLADELPPVDLVVANIELRLVEALLARRPASAAIVSGYLAHEFPRAGGWRPTGRLELEGWAADVLVVR